MSWWLWMLIILVLVIGILMSGWWIISVTDLNMRSQPWPQRLAQKPKINFYDKLDKVDQSPTIVIMVVGNQWKDEDRFWPIFLFGTDNLKQGINYWNKKIMHDWQNDHPSIIVDYLKDTNQELDQIDFYVFKKIKNQKAIPGQTKTFVEKFELSERSFNKVLG